MGAVGNGIANPAQKVLDVDSTMGRKLPHSLHILAFGTVLGNSTVPAAARALARQSGIPSSHVTTFDYQNTYSHNDPAGAYPKNAFFAALVKFLARISP